MEVGQASLSAGMAAQVLKDVAGAQLITQTLDRLNGSPTGPQAGNADYEFQKTVLNAAGIGKQIDLTV